MQSRNAPLKAEEVPWRLGPEHGGFEDVREGGIAGSEVMSTSAQDEAGERERGRQRPDQTVKSFPGQHGEVLKIAQHLETKSVKQEDNMVGPAV